MSPKFLLRKVVLDTIARKAQSAYCCSLYLCVYIYIYMYMHALALFLWQAKTTSLRDYETQRPDTTVLNRKIL